MKEISCSEFLGHLHLVAYRCWFCWLLITFQLGQSVVQDSVPEVLNNVPGSESPSSPISSYNNSPFNLEDFNEKLPELPPLLQQSPLDRLSSISYNPESLEKPLTAMLNHLYIQRGRTGQSLVALSSTHRFRTKYVTAVLYKPLKKVKKWNT